MATLHSLSMPYALWAFASSLHSARTSKDTEHGKRGH